MTVNISELSSKRTTLHGKIKDLASKFEKNGKTWPNDQQRKDWEAINAEYDRVAGELNELQAVEGVASRISQLERDASRPINPRGIGFDDAGDGMVGGRRSPGHDGEGSQLAGREYVVDQRGRKQPLLRKGESLAAELLKQHPAIAAEYEGLGVGEYVRAMVLGPKTQAERNALSHGGDSGGTYTVPVRLAAELVDMLRAKSQVIQAGAGTISLDTQQTSYAKLISEPTPVWRHENVEIPEQTATFGAINIDARSLGMVVRCSRELLEDSINLNSKLPVVFARAMASEIDRVSLMGNGAAAEPLGLFNMAGINSVSMGDNGGDIEDFSQILNAVEAIETDNAMTPTAAIMHPRTGRAYAGLVDTTGQPLRRPVAIEGMSFLPTTKIPTTQTQGSANNASSVLIGGFSELVLAIRSELRIEVLKERFAEYYQYGFVVTMRADVTAWHEQAFAKIIGIIPS